MIPLEPVPDEPIPIDGDVSGLLEGAEESTFRPRADAEDVVRDPDFKSTLGRRAVLDLGANDPASYRRLLVEPRGALLLLSVWLIGLAWSGPIPSGDGRQFLIVAGTLLAIQLGLPWLFGVRCLDCGRLLRVWNWSSHVCPNVALRVACRKPRRWTRGPGPWIQGIGWILFLNALAMWWMWKHVGWSR